MGKLLDDFISFAFSLGVDVIVILSLKSTELRLKLNTKDSRIFMGVDLYETNLVSNQS